MEPEFIPPPAVDPTPEHDYTGRYVVLARSLKDAWRAAAIHGLGTGDWVFPRTLEEARELADGLVVEAPAFHERPDSEAFRAATAHLDRLEISGV